MSHRGRMQRESAVLDENGEYPLPIERTEFCAGSTGKVEIMRQRLEVGEHLHHPFDCKQILVEDEDPVKRSRNLYQSERISRWLASLAS